MAEAMQCDRCGVYFKPNTYKNDIVSIGKKSKANGLISYSDWYDLCPDCINEFKKFIGQSEDKNEMET